MCDVVSKTSISPKRWRGGRGVPESKENREKGGIEQVWEIIFLGGKLVNINMRKM